MTRDFFFGDSPWPINAVKAKKCFVAIFWGWVIQIVFWCNIEDRPTDRPTDLAFWKISNGHISAMGRPIHFMFGSRVGFSRSADWMALFPVAPNPRWRPSWKISNGHISGMGCPIDFHELQSSLEEWSTGENNARGVIRLVTIWNISCSILFREL